MSSEGKRDWASPDVKSMEQRCSPVDVGWYLVRFVVEVETGDSMDKFTIKDKRMPQNVNQDLEWEFGEKRRAVILCLSSMIRSWITIKRAHNADLQFFLGGFSQNQIGMSNARMATHIFFPGGEPADTPIVES